MGLGIELLACDL